MADYNDYLEYLHHVDDTTAQEFKKKEDELRHQIDVVRDQCQKDIKNIQERAAAEKAQLVVDHKSAIDSLTSQYESSVEKLNTEKKQIETAHKAELKRINTEKENAITQLINEKNAVLAKVKAEKESAINQLTNEHTSVMDAALSAAEKKRKSEVEKLTNKVSQYDHLLQQKEEASSDLIKKHHQEVTELNLKHEKQIEIINEHNEEKLRGLASQLQSEKDKLKDIEKIWQNKLLLNNQECEQKLKEQETEKNKYLSIISDEKKTHEQHVARLNHDIQALKSENNSIRASRLTISNQLEATKRKNGILESNLNEMIEKIKELEKGIPAMDSKNGLLAFLLILFVLGLIIIYIFI